MKQRGSFQIVHIIITFLIILGIAYLPTNKPDPVPVKNPVKLPVVGSFSKLKNLLKESVTQYGSYVGDDRLAKNAEVEMKALSAPVAAERSADLASTKSGYSETNVQVQGVDEADIVKTDGEYIYKISERKLSIVRAAPADQMRVVASVPFEPSKFQPRELYVDDKHITVIGQAFGELDQSAPEPGLLRDEQLQVTRPSTVKALIFDNSDKAHPRKIREVEIEGFYLSSRKIGSAVYLVANKDLDFYRIMEEPEDKQETTPKYRDSARSDEYKRVGYSQIRYFPEPSQANYLLVAGFNLDDPDQKMSVNTYLGAGENIYASLKNLYVAAVKPGPAQTGEASTAVYRFALNEGEVSLKSQGEVPGTILNQFSMDEHNGYFRIATTEQRFEPSDAMSWRNNLFVLDNDLKIAGKITDIAPGERIYSARFMGDRAYMVTFREIDPFFVIDLLDPSNPGILGELKIPGYSDYLHVYDANHIIGFGKDGGMKIAVFDVTDVERPVEKFKTIIGDQGTESELLRNHKALLFDKDRGLLAFPVTVMEIENGPPTDPAPRMQAYREFTFQGAYIYNIDIEKGFKLRAKITHKQLNDKNLGYGTLHVKRILRIDDTLYTVSDEIIKATDFKTLKEKTRVKL